MKPVSLPRRLSQVRVSKHTKQSKSSQYKTEDANIGRLQNKNDSFFNSYLVFSYVWDLEENRIQYILRFLGSIISVSF